MSSASFQIKPTLAFFGATGGSCVACLDLALQGGYSCRALVRSSSKLQKLLQDREVDKGTISTHLTIIEGNVKDTAAVTKTVQVEPNRVVDIIVSGIGGTPTFTPNPLRPSLDDPTICQDATSTILSSLRAISQTTANKPLLVALSTTGISDAGRDIPLAMIPLYHWLLAVPHQDKREMERLLKDEMAATAGKPAAIRGFIAVRPSLLTDGKRLGVDKVRVGTEESNAGNHAADPAVGYTISRADVGGWIYDEVICRKEEERKQWFDKMVSITY